MRDSLVAVAVALLCVLALGVGAAGLQELTDDPDSGPPEVEGEEGGEQPEEPSQDSQASGNDPQRLALDGDTSDACIAGFNQNDLALLTLVFSFSVTLIAVVITRQPVVGALVLPVVFIPSMAIMLVVTAFLGCPVPAQEAITNVENLTTAQNVSGGNTTAQGDSNSFWGDIRLFGLMATIALGAFIMALYVQRRNAGDVSEGQNYQVDDAPEEIGRVAGELADEIEDGVAVSNGVYDAWTEMTDILDIDDPETSTPGEFRDAALAAGLERQDVEELTDLFEEVRYGTARPTEERETRALEALRRIERTYSKQGGGGGRR